MRSTRVNTRKMVRTFYRSGWRRPFWLLGLVTMALLVGRVALNPMLERVVRRRLDGLQGVATARFRDLDVFLWPPSFTFRDVVVRGPSGEALEADRVEVHLASLLSLRDPVPQIRVRLVRPQLRVVPGAGDLGRWVRALPAARAEVVGVENGSIGNALAGDSRAVFQAVNGDIEGLAFGSALDQGEAAVAGVGGRPRVWQAWLDMRVDGVDPAHAIVGLQVGGAWDARLTVQQISRSPSGSGVVAIDARVTGGSVPTRASVSISWPGPEAPVAAAQDRIGRLSALWPPTHSTRLTNLSVADLRAGTGAAGQSVDLVAIEENDRTGAPSPLPPFDAVGLLVGLVRISNQSVLPPPPGMAALAGPGPVTNPPSQSTPPSGLGGEQPN